ncbi:MAG TPA: SDR family NAD(P)-dependent oxidoreductase [Frankiaceae bacterium]|nr:SDR family NAD(P)-dependent oxidoreductase [Frankiaceae bacterium]
MTSSTASAWRLGRTSDRFAGRVALVTGAGGAGIGSAVAGRLASEGASILALDSHAGRTDAIVEVIAKTYEVPVIGITVDIADRPAVDAALKRGAELGVVDILVNNAAINTQGSIFDYDPEVFSEVVDVDLTAAWYLMHKTVGPMRELRRGAIVNVGSVAAYNGGRGREAPYSAAKAGLHELTRSVAIEGGPYGIRCNAVAPGIINSRFLAKHQERFQVELQATPLRRFGDPDDVANAVAFLVCDESSFITGEVITVSGGWYLRP